VITGLGGSAGIAVQMVDAQGNFELGDQKDHDHHGSAVRPGAPSFEGSGHFRAKIYSKPEAPVMRQHTAKKQSVFRDCLKTGPEACWQVDTFSGHLTGAQSPQSNMITSV